MINDIMNAVNIKTRTRRIEAMKNVMCSQDLDEDKRDILAWNLKMNKYVTWSSRATVFPFLIYLYKKGFFEGSSSKWQKEFMLVGGCVGYVVGSEIGVNLYTWSSTAYIIQDFRKSKEMELRTRYKEAMDIQQLDESQLIDDE